MPQQTTTGTTATTPAAATKTNAFCTCIFLCMVPPLHPPCADCTADQVRGRRPTVLGWATFYFTQNVFGDLGIIALLFTGVVFGSGILTQTDFNAFPWHMLFLLGGGHVLGACWPPGTCSNSGEKDGNSEKVMYILWFFL